MLLMGKPTISMAIFNSYLYVYQGVAKYVDCGIDPMVQSQDPSQIGLGIDWNHTHISSQNGAGI